MGNELHVVTGPLAIYESIDALPLRMTVRHQHTPCAEQEKAKEEGSVKAQTGGFSSKDTNSSSILSISSKF
mgnify:FL=1